MNEIQAAENKYPAIQNDQKISEKLIQNWIEFIDCSEESADTYKRALKQFLLWLREKGIKNPARNDLITFREDLLKTHKPETVKLYLIAVRSFFSWTGSQEGPDGKPLYPDIGIRVKSPKTTKEHKKDYLTASQAKELLESIDRSGIKGKRDYALILLMLTGGLRTVSVEKADIGDIRNVGGESVLFYQGKGHSSKDEYVKLPPVLDKAIREYLQSRNEIRKASKEDPLFISLASNHAMERLKRRSIRYLVKERMKDIGLTDERLTTHSLRHTAATLNLLNGGTLEETKQLLGHSSLDTTLIYSHALQRSDNHSELRIAQVITGGDFTD